MKAAKEMIHPFIHRLAFRNRHCADCYPAAVGAAHPLALKKFFLPLTSFFSCDISWMCTIKGI
jgi:hypothetical protein